MYDMPETFGQYNFNNYYDIGMLHSSMLNAYNIVGAEECMKDVEAALWQQAVREGVKSSTCILSTLVQDRSTFALRGGARALL